jgi:hypothetical protein
VPRNPATAEAWYRAAARGGLGAASARLPALMRAGRATASPPPGDLSLVRPVPVAPVDAVLPTGQNLSKVALVWNTPEQPVPVEYFVELRALDVSGSREVAASYVETSATLVALAGAPQLYAWRVYAVARSRRALCYQPLELVLNRQGCGGLTCRSRCRARRRAGTHFPIKRRAKN